MTNASWMHSDNNNWPLDLAIVVLTTVCGTVALVMFDMFERLQALFVVHETWELDELFLATIMLVISLAWFSWRRWRESERSLKQQIALDNQLRQTDAELSFLVSASPGVQYTCRPDGDFAHSFVSAHVKDQLGYDPEAFTNDPKFWANHIHPSDAKQVFANMVSLFEQGHFTHEYRFRHADGSVRWIHDQLSILYDRSGKPERICGIWIDITERKRMEEALRTSERRLKAIFDNVPAALFLKGTDSRYKLINRRYAEWFEIDPDAIIGKTVYDLYPKERAERYEAGDRKMLQTGAVETDEVDIPLPSGETRCFTLIKFPIWDGARIQDIGAVMVDVTERIKALEAMREAKELAEEAGRAKSEFLANMSHELRTPLTSIKGSLGLIREGVLGILPEKCGDVIDIAYRNSIRLENLINDVLDIQKIEAGMMDFEIRPLAATALIEMAIEANKGYGENYGIEFVMSPSSTDALVEGDESRLMQVFANLMSNAAKFSPRGSRVEIGSARVGGAVRFSVTDNGCGIPESFRDGIFDRFSQLDSTSTRQVGGSGLGLNIAKNIVELHHGTIDFCSEMNSGTTFHFDLPEMVQTAAEIKCL